MCDPGGIVKGGPQAPLNTRVSAERILIFFVGHRGQSLPYASARRRFLR